MINTREDLKKAGIINAILIVVAFVMGIIAFFCVSAILWKINILLTLVALVFGFFYASLGYKKDVAKYYKRFFLIYAVTSLINLIGSIIAMIDLNINFAFNANTTTVAIYLIVLICAALLAFGKDLKKEKSTLLGVIIVAMRAIILFVSIPIYSVRISALYYHILNLILAMILCFFVIAKYIDKDMRGTK